MLTAMNARGYNPWRVSITIAEMVKNGYLDIVKGKYDDKPGRTKRQTFRATETGYAWATVKETTGWAPGVDIETAADKAIDAPGKWFPLPQEAGEDQMAALRKRGFEVRVVVMMKPESEGKA